MGVTVACVLRSGGTYDVHWVTALRRGVQGHLPGARFVCLSDVPVSGEHIRLAHDWPKWWAKVELFRPGLFGGPVLYLDLDTLPVGDLSQIADYRGPLAMLSDFYRPERAQSGVMAFTPGPVTEGLWEMWSASPQMHMHRYRGDGEWLHEHCSPDRLQELYPGQIVSLKVQAREEPPNGARLVCGHGRPRFDDPKAGWAHQLWRARI
jgi:hypothetical protein